MQSCGRLDDCLSCSSNLSGNTKHPTYHTPRVEQRNGHGLAVSALATVKRDEARLVRCHGGVAAGRRRLSLFVEHLCIGAALLNTQQHTPGTTTVEVKCERSCRAISGTKAPTPPPRPRIANRICKSQQCNADPRPALPHRLVAAHPEATDPLWQT